MAVLGLISWQTQTQFEQGTTHDLGWFKWIDVYFKPMGAKVRIEQVNQHVEPSITSGGHRASVSL